MIRKGVLPSSGADVIRCAAIHEAGHAVVVLALAEHFVLEAVTVVPTAACLGLTQWRYIGSTADEHEADAIVAVAGDVAEKLAGGSDDGSYRPPSWPIGAWSQQPFVGPSGFRFLAPEANDGERLQMAASAIGSTTRYERELVAVTAEGRARRALQRNWRLVGDIASALCWHGTLTGLQALSIKAVGGWSRSSAVDSSSPQGTAVGSSSRGHPGRPASVSTSGSPGARAAERSEGAVTRAAISRPAVRGLPCPPSPFGGFGDELAPGLPSLRVW